MSYQFEGKTYEKLADWIRDYPLYRHYPDLLRAGINTVAGMTKAIYERKQNARNVQLQAARRNDAFNGGIKRKRK